MIGHFIVTFAEEGYFSFQGPGAQGKVARCGQGRTGGQPDARWIICHLAGFGAQTYKSGQDSLYLGGYL